MMEKAEKNWLEWIIFGISFVLVIGLIGYLVWTGFTNEAAPPDIVVELGETQQQGDSYLIPIKLSNNGGETAKSVTVEVTLMKGEQELETAEIAVDFVPRSSNRNGWMIFTEDPAEADEIEVHVLGYEEP